MTYPLEGVRAIDADAEHVFALVPHYVQESPIKT